MTLRLTHKVMLFVGLVAALAALAVLLPGSARPAAGGTDLPFNGPISGTTTVNLQTGAVHNVSVGVATHFGLGTNVQDGWFIPTGQTTFNLVITHWTLTAANGDQMFGTAAGSGHAIDATHSTASVLYTSTGGTGRFADASLSFTATVVDTRVSVENGILTNAVEGTADGSLSLR